MNDPTVESLVERVTRLKLECERTLKYLEMEPVIHDYGKAAMEEGMRPGEMALGDFVIRDRFLKPKAARFKMPCDFVYPKFRKSPWATLG